MVRTILAVGIMATGLAVTNVKAQEVQLSVDMHDAPEIQLEQPQYFQPYTETADLPDAPVAGTADSEPNYFQHYRPASPIHRPIISKMEAAALLADATARTLDWTSTQEFLRRPDKFHEGELPAALVKSKVGFAAFQFGIVAGLGIAHYEFEKHGHHKLANLVLMGQFADAGTDGYTGIHNYTKMIGYQNPVPATSTVTPANTTGTFHVVSGPR
jgi:hypothetical protein